MELGKNWLKGICAGTLIFGIVAMPLAAQDKEKAPAKKHKISHKKKTHTKKTRKAKKLPPPIEMPTTPPPVQVDKSVPTEPSGPIPGRPYDETTWRGFHSDWNGQYHFNAGKYYYDDEFKYQAQIPSEFSSVASRFGGVATLENDPTLVFTGDAGEPYPILDYNSDRYKSDKRLKLKSAYFGRAYFWRDGFRYDRKLIVNDKGARCFQFVKHP